MRRFPLTMTPLILLLMGTSALAQPAGQLQLPPLPASGGTVAPPALAAPAAPASAIPTTAPVAAADPIANGAQSALTPPGTEPLTGANIAVMTAPAAAPYSFGDADVSLIFMPEQIQKMKAALTVYEERMRRAGAVGENGAINTVDILPPPMVEPPAYPVFYLSSIVYRSPKDWTLWVSGHKITPRKNDTDLKVVGISPGAAVFAWKPTYNEALSSRKQRNLFVAPDKVKNRMVPPAFTYDETNGIVTFKLKSNQSFVVGYFNLFEGYLDSPAMPVLQEAPVAGAATPVAPATSIAAPAPLSVDPATTAVDTLQNRSLFQSIGKP